MDGRKRALRIVVLDARPDPRHARVTAAIAHALTTAMEDGPSDSEPPRIGPDSVLPKPSTNPLDLADAAVVLDPSSWVRAREAKVPFVAVVLPSFDTAWAGDLSQADCVLVAHAGLVDDVVHRGADRARVHVAGPVAPHGFHPTHDRASIRRRAGITSDVPLALVTADAVDQVGLEDLVARLNRLPSTIGVLFDVGEDVELAEALRGGAAGFSFGAWMFADGPGVRSWWRLADLVLATPRGHEVSQAFGVGAPILLLPPGRSDRLAAEVLSSTGAARVCRELDSVAADIEAALAAPVVAASRLSVAQLDAVSGAARVASVVRQVWRGARAPRGLPHGVEKVR